MREVTKDNIEAAIKLLDHAQTAINERRSYQWPVNILLWSGVPVSAGYVSANMNYNSVFAIFASLFYLTLLIIYCQRWTTGIEGAYQTNKEIESKCLKMLEGEAGIDFQPKNQSYDEWIKTYNLITSLVVFASIGLVWFGTTEAQIASFVKKFESKAKAIEAIDRLSN